MKNCCVVLRYGSNAIFLGSVEATDVNVSSNITSYPIYSGDTVGEHMIREPITVSLRGSYAVNGSDGILINNDVPSLKRFQQEMEALRDNGTLCDYYKIAYNPSDPRFVKRTGMALKNISWVEHFNSLEFSLSFQQVFVASVASGPSIYAGQSNYSNGSEQMPGSYNPNTGVVTDLPTGQTANTSRAPGEVSYDDFGITEKNDEYLPDFSEPYSGQFLPNYLDKEKTMAAIIALCCDMNVVDQAFLQYYKDTADYTVKLGVIPAAVGLVAGLIAKGIVTKVAGDAAIYGLSAAAVGGFPVFLGVIAAVGIAVGVVFILRGVIGAIEITEKKNKFKEAAFRVSNDQKKNREATKEFNQFLEKIYQKLLQFDENFLVYEFPNGETHQQEIITVGGAQLNVEVEKTANGLGCKFISGGETFQTGDMYASAKTDYGECGNNADFGVFDGDKIYYGYIMFSGKKIEYRSNEGSTGGLTINDIATPDPRDFILVISSMGPDDFSRELSNIVLNYIYTNYQDVIGEG